LTIKERFIETASIIFEALAVWDSLEDLDSVVEVKKRGACKRAELPETKFQSTHVTKRTGRKYDSPSNRSGEDHGVNEVKKRGRASKIPAKLPKTEPSAHVSALKSTGRKNDDDNHDNKFPESKKQASSRQYSPPPSPSPSSTSSESTSSDKESTASSDDESNGENDEDHAGNDDGDEEIDGDERDYDGRKFGPKRKSQPQKKFQNMKRKKRPKVASNIVPKVETKIESKIVSEIVPKYVAIVPTKIDKKIMYPCQHCPYETRHQHLLGEHTTRHSINGIYACKRCKYACDKFQEYSKHKLYCYDPNDPPQKPTKSKPFPNASYIFVSNKNNRDSNELQVRPQAKSKTTHVQILRCLKCNYTSERKDLLALHSKTCHEAPKKKMKLGKSAT
jgi:hypothetical protein